MMVVIVRLDMHRYLRWRLHACIYSCRGTVCARGVKWLPLRARPSQLRREIQERVWLVLRSVLRLACMQARMDVPRLSTLSSMWLPASSTLAFTSADGTLRTPRWSVRTSMPTCLQCISSAALREESFAASREWCVYLRGGCDDDSSEPCVF